MNAYIPPLLKAQPFTPGEVGLEPADRPQIKALCEAGYLPLARYVELVAALGWDRPAQAAAPDAARPLPPMAQQPRRERPITSVA